MATILRLRRRPVNMLCFALYSIYLCASHRKRKKRWWEEIASETTRISYLGESYSGQFGWSRVSLLHCDIYIYTSQMWPPCFVVIRYYMERAVDFPRNIHFKEYVRQLMLNSIVDGKPFFPDPESQVTILTVNNIVQGIEKQKRKSFKSGTSEYVLEPETKFIRHTLK